MENRNLKRMDFEEKYSDEIDLYDIVNILVKRKKTIILTFIVGLIITTFSVIYYRKGRIDPIGIKYSLNYDVIDNDGSINLKVYNYKKIDPINLFEKNGNIEKMFEISQIKDEFDSKFKGIDEDILIDLKRKFLSGALKLKGSLTEKSNNDFELSLYMKKLQKNDAEKIINKYFEILDANINEEIFDKIDKEHEKLLIVKENVKKAILKNNVDQRSRYQKDNQEANIIYSEKDNFAEELSRNYYENEKKILAIDYLKNNKDKVAILKRESSIMKIEQKGKTKLILGVGVILSLVLAIIFAFIGEFISNYKSRKV